MEKELTNEQIKVKCLEMALATYNQLPDTIVPKAQEYYDFIKSKS